MRRLLIVAALLVAAAAPAALVPAPAEAQATCRNKCNEEEQACLQRTGNKGQCGNRAKACAEKCK